MKALEEVGAWRDGVLEAKRKNSKSKTGILP